MLRNGSEISENGHEIMIIIPAGNDVKMKVIGYTRTGGFADITTDIEAMRRKSLFENRGASLEHFHHCQIFIGFKFCNASYMPYRCDEQMSICIRVSIQKDKNFTVTIEE
jgi:hypothetical protein